MSSTFNHSTCTPITPSKNRPAKIWGKDKAVLTEDTDVNICGDLHATGKLNISDQNYNESSFCAGQQEGVYGSLTLSSTGNWSYKANNHQIGIQSLGKGDTAYDSFTVKSADGTTHCITIEINGVNDKPCIWGDTRGEVTEDNCVDACGNLNAKGKLNVKDVDQGQSFFVQNSYCGDFGFLKIDACGNWTYKATNAQKDIQSLDECEAIYDSFKVETEDGTTQRITIKINGENDCDYISWQCVEKVKEDNCECGKFRAADYTYFSASDYCINNMNVKHNACIWGDSCGEVTENHCVNACGLLTTSGKLYVEDPDCGEASFICETYCGDLGKLKIDSCGNWTYEVKNNAKGLQYLNDCQTLLECYKVQTVDGTCHKILIKINGSSECSADTQNNVDNTTQIITESITDNPKDNSTDPTDTSTDNPTNDPTENPMENTTENTPDTNAAPVEIIPNENPLAMDDTASTDENTSLVITAASGVLSNDTDANITDILTVSAINGDAGNVNKQFTLNSGALLIANTEGGYVYNPNGAYDYLSLGETAQDSFTYQVSDNQGGTATGTVTITIAGVNDNPVAVDDNATTDKKTAFSQTAATGLLANDSDLDLNDSHTISQVNGVTAYVNNQITLASGALLTVNADGSYSYDPNGIFPYLGADESQVDGFTYKISDNHGGFDVGTVTITITGVNDNPVAASDSASTDEDTSFSITAASGLLANDTDIDISDTHTVTAVNGIAAIVGTQIGLPSGALLKVNADGSYAYNPNGAFDYLAEGETAQDSFTYQVSDNHGGSSTETVTITINGVNDNPVAAPDSATTDEGTAISMSVASGLLANDTDVDVNDTHTVTAVNGVAGDVNNQISLPSGALLTVNADGSYDYDPNGAFEYLAAGETAQDSFTYQVSDNHGGVATETVTLTINGVNDNPVAAPDSATTDEDTAISVPAVSGLLANDTDIDISDTHTVTAVNGIAAIVGTQVGLPSGALLKVNADGSYDYDPNGAFEYLAAGETAQDSFTYQVSDNHGGVATETVTLTINGVNDNPVAVADTATTDEDTAISVPAASGLLANDTDVDVSDTHTVTAVNGVAGDVNNQISLASGALLKVNADGSYDYDPNGAFESLAEGESAQDSFTYQASDNHGGVATETVTLTINGVNDNPVAAPDSATTDEDTAISVPAASGLLANDTDVDVSDTHTVTAVNGVAGNVNNEISLPSGALLKVNADGSYDYDPNGAFESLAQGESAQDSFTYQVSDNHGGVATETVTLTINGVNDNPVAVADTATTDEDTAISVPAASGLLANDTDVDVSDTHTVTAVNGVAGDVNNQISLASGALLKVNADGSYDYDPNGAFESLAEGESAQDSFTYQASDNHGGVATETVTLTINGVNDNPVAAPDSATTDEDTAISVPAASGLLANDTDIDISDTHTVTAVNGVAGNVNNEISLPSGALLKVNADGSYDYNPNGAFESLAEGESAQDSFTYQVSDNHGGTATETVTLTINGVNDAAIIAGVDGASITEDTNVTVDGCLFTSGLLTVSDIDNGENGFQPSVQTSDLGDFTLDIYGNWEYKAYNGQDAIQTMRAGDSKNDSFTIQSIDGTTHQVTITINGLNDPALIGGTDAQSIKEDTNVTADGKLLASGTLTVSDVDVGQSAFQAGTQTSAIGSLTIDSLGNWQYQADNSQLAIQSLGEGSTLQDLFTISSVDGTTHQINITINGQNDIAVISGTDTGLVTEDTNVSSGGYLTFNAALSINDVDSGQNVFQPSTQTSTLGKFTLDTAGNWQYQALNSQKAIQSLGGNSSVQESFTIQSADGTSHQITLTIQGKNDPAVIGGVESGSVTEDTNVSKSGKLTASGALTITDVDTGEASFISGNQTGLLGTLQINGNGQWDYNAVNKSTAVQALNTGTTVIDSFTVLSVDGTPHVISISVHGLNEVPPVVLDLNDDNQIELISYDDSEVTTNAFLGTADGVNYAMGWVGPNDGILVYDPNDTGNVTDINQISFVGYVDGAKTDLEGLCAFDSNQNNSLDIKDESYEHFGVWQDKNSNGVVDPGEYATLTEKGISAINLNSSGECEVLASNTIHGYTHYQTTDGENHMAADVSLNVKPLQISDILTINDGVDENAVINFDDVLVVPNEAVEANEQNYSAPLMSVEHMVDQALQAIPVHII